MQLCTIGVLLVLSVILSCWAVMGDCRVSLVVVVLLGYLCGGLCCGCIIGIYCCVFAGLGGSIVVKHFEIGDMYSR